MRSLIIVWIIFLVSISSSPGGNDRKTPDPPPHIIFILLAAARADHFSSYGYDKKTTPAIDALGRNGVIFLKNFTHATETQESISLIMTSRYLSRPIRKSIGRYWPEKPNREKRICDPWDISSER